MEVNEASAWALSLGSGRAFVWAWLSNGSVFVGQKDTAVVDTKRSEEEEEEEGAQARGGSKTVSIPRLRWPVFLGHFVFWETMLPLGKCLFS